ncbi:MAG: SRPBCC family protein, partial [Pseudonocardiaceae bacterium]
VSDEHGNVPATGVGADASHPTTTEVRIELQPVPTGTKMTLTHVGVAAESPGAAGWAMALNKLAATLASHTRH